MDEHDKQLAEWIAVQSQLGKLFVHDLKNPISALSANLSYMESALSHESEDIRGAVSDSILAAEMLLRFAENLSYLSRLEVEEECEVTAASLRNLLDGGYKRNDPFARSAGVNLRIRDAVPERSVLGQYKLMEAALDNLILSAVRHSPPSGLVEIGAAVEGDFAKVTVYDRGRPIGEEYMATLLTREGQVEAKRHSDSRYGRGLGLYLAGLSARALSGSIEIGSQDGVTFFCLRFPLECE
ncbi:MAG: HAMP domain-containing histidine kinase [Myxococcota bacterium]|jgi:signal transduction histidine kinase|nr:HAMP domain-containing histidine kinase [Myxococcota bacterium]